MSTSGMRAFDAVFDAQRVFRRVLEATAQPGKLFVLPPKEASPQEAVALALLDHEVSSCVIGGEEEGIGERLPRATGSRPAPVEEADFALVAEGFGRSVLGLRRGTLERPELGATAILSVERLSNSGPLILRLTGPGVPDERMLGVEGLSPEEAGAIRESREDYPLGVDVYLVDGAGRISGLPRSTRLEVV